MKPTPTCSASGRKDVRGSQGELPLFVEGLKPPSTVCRFHRGGIGALQQVNDIYDQVKALPVFEKRFAGKRW